MEVYLQNKMLLWKISEKLIDLDKFHNKVLCEIYYGLMQVIKKGEVQVKEGLAVILGLISLINFEIKIICNEL